jgi:hypothetical protein
MKSVIIIDWAKLSKNRKKSNNAWKKFFKELDITQKDIAEILGVQPVTVCQWFRRGIPRNRLVQLEAIRDAILKLEKNNNEVDKMAKNNPFDKASKPVPMAPEPNEHNTEIKKEKIKSKIIRQRQQSTSK